RRFLDMVETAMEAKAKKPLAARSEGRSRRHADIGAVDDVEGGLLRIRHALDLEEQVEGARRDAEAHAPGVAEHAADDVARFLRLRDLAGEEPVALVQRRNRAALHERRDAGGRVLNEVLEHAPERWMRAQPADAPAGH